MPILKGFMLLKVAFKHSKKMTLGVLFFRFLKGLMPALNMVAVGLLINAMVASYEKGHFGEPLLLALLFFSLLYVLSAVITRLSSYIESKHQIEFGGHMEAAMTEKRSRLLFESYEDEEKGELISRVATEGLSRVVEGFYTLLSVGDYFIQMASMVVVIAFQNLSVALMASLLFAALVPVAKRCGVEDYEAFKASSALFRKSKFLRETMIGRSFVDERTVFGYTKTMNGLWKNQYEEARRVNALATRKNYVNLKGASLAVASIAFAIALILAWPLSKGQMSSGIYIALVGGLLKMVQMMSWSFGYAVEDLVSSLYFMKDYETFFSLEETHSQHLMSEGIQTFSKIVFKEVSFRYGDGPYVLKDLNFVIENGKHYAFVGENGAGKSTIIKLLLGLYSTYEGQILVDGLELRTLNARALKALYSVVFQDYARYQVTAGENLLLGGTEPASEAAILEVLDLLDLKSLIDALPEGLDTPLGKLEVEGVDLSGGQWQRLAIARALLKKAHIHVMDEPSAALDPIYEAELYQMFNDFFRNRCTILITHRLGAVTRADVIYVLEKGQIVEAGAHESLMQAKGPYENMYTTQKGWYLA